MSQYFDDDTIDEIRSHLSLETIFRHYYIDMQKHKCKMTARNCVMRCPLGTHEDVKPSFSINTSSLEYNCFSCGKKGRDGFSFIAEMEKLSTKANFREVVERAAQIAGVNLESDGRPERKSQEEIRIKVQEHLSAEDKLKKEAAEKYFRKKGVDLRTLDIPWGAENDKEYGADIVIPMLAADLSGVWVGAQRGRKKVMAGSTLGLFYDERHVSPRGEEVYVVEGLSDYLSMIAAGYTNVIGLVSATINKKDIADALTGYKNVRLCLDLDKHKATTDNKGGLAGAKAMLSLSAKIDRKTTNVKMYTLGEDHKFDLNDLYNDGGRKKLDEFFENHITNMNDMATTVGLSSNPDAFSCAEIFILRNTVAVDTGARQQWVCDPKTNVWSMTKKSNIENNIRLLIESVRSTGHSTKMINETLKYVGMLTAGNLKHLLQNMARGQLVTVDPEDLEGTVFLCLKDGKYFPFTKKFAKYKPEDYIYSTLDVSYDEVKTYGDAQVKGSAFIKFLKSIFKGDKDIKERIAFMQEWFGYILFPTNIFEKFLVIQGSGGNGKGTMLDCIGEIIGEDNFANMELEDLAESRFASSHLLGKYANLCSEGSRKSVLDTPALKKITGGDILTAEQKFNDQFQFRPFCKIVVATNPDPSVNEDSDWLGRRMHLIRFNNTFRGKENIFLKDGLRKEKGIIFTWALAGLMRILKNQKFTLAPSVEADTKELLSSADMITPFIGYLERQNTQPGMRNIEEIGHMYKEFTIYMTEYQGRTKRFVPNQRRFMQDMLAKGYELVRKSNGPCLVKKDQETIDIDDIDFDLD